MRFLADFDYDPFTMPFFVSSPEELEQGILQGRIHIVVIAHLDLTSLPSKPTSACNDGCESPLPVVSLTETIRVRARMMIVS